MGNLRDSVIKLAQEVPELREHLVPLVKQSVRARPQLDSVPDKLKRFNDGLKKFEAEYSIRIPELTLAAIRNPLTVEVPLTPVLERLFDRVEVKVGLTMGSYGMQSAEMSVIVSVTAYPHKGAAVREYLGWIEDSGVVKI